MRTEIGTDARKRSVAACRSGLTPSERRGGRLVCLLAALVLSVVSGGDASSFDSDSEAARSEGSQPNTERPNVFIAISDDQSWLHASAYGSKMVATPHFDRVAREGVLFTHAIAPSPGCSPSRAAFLTGRNTWQLEHAGTHASFFDEKYETFPDRLAGAGYHTGYTGKGWGPGDFKRLGRTQNPAGPRVNAKAGGHVAAFAAFLKSRPKDAPFCFWFGTSDPHRSYVPGSGIKKGKKLSDAEVPPFLPDRPEIRSDLLDYAFEIERFDDDLGGMLGLLTEAGELENTLVIVLSDNGMPFPRAKANVYEYGIRMPLAIRWGRLVPGGRTVDDLVGFTDLTATIYEVARVTPSERFPTAGRSLVSLLRSESSGVIEPERDAVYSARERHSSSRFNSLGYPQRCIRTREYLYIINFTPERWPAGPAQKYRRAVYQGREPEDVELGPAHGGYHDIDACPTLTYLIERRAEPEVGRFLELAVGKRPREELFDIKKDPGCLNNLAADPRFAAVRAQLETQLLAYLRQTGDPRVTGDGDVWESYPRVSRLRWFPKPDWAIESPGRVPEQAWLEKRRPRKQAGTSEKD